MPVNFINAIYLFALQLLLLVLKFNSFVLFEMTRYSPNILSVVPFMYKYYIIIFANNFYKTSY